MSRAELLDLAKRLGEVAARLAKAPDDAQAFADREAKERRDQYPIMVGWLQSSCLGIAKDLEAIVAGLSPNKRKRSA